MIRILTQDFTELDLVPGTEFQLTMENPMFDEGHLPTCFSTQISFPASPTNREIFGYTPILMRPPLIQVLAVSIWIGGVPFMSGRLVYDGIDDNNLQYTFTQKLPELESKIWDQSILEFNTDTLPEGGSSIYATFRTPLVIRKNNVAMQPYLKGPTDDNLWLKYWNYKTSGKGYDYSGFMPAFPVATILAGIPLKTPDDLEFRLRTISILGRYHEYATRDVVVSSAPTPPRSGSSTTTSISSDRSSRGSTSRTSVSSGASRRNPSKTTDLATFLPDISFADLLKNIASILCASFFQDGGALRMATHESILGNTSPLDWSNKISDKYSAEVQPGCSYKFGYNDDDDVERPDLDSRSTNYVESMDEDGFDPRVILEGFGNSGNYAVVYDRSSGDIYSGRSYQACKDISTPSGYSAPEVYDCDVVYHNAKSVSSEVEDEDSGSFNNMSSFKLVRCVPEKIFPTKGEGSYPTESDATYRMVPIVKQNSVSEGRDSEVYIGVIDNLLSQMTDHDLYLPSIVMENDTMGSYGLTPPQLWDEFHKTFAEWLSRRRQTVKAGVSLSASELHSLTLDKTVYFKGKRWIIKELSITMRAGTDILLTSGSFVEI